MPKKLIVILLIILPAFAVSFAAPVNVIHSDNLRLVLEYTSPGAKIERAVINGMLLQTVKPDSGEHILRIAGRPEVPFLSFLVAIPPVGDISLKIIPENSEEITNVRLPLAPDLEMIETEAGGYMREIPAKVDSQKFDNLIFPEKLGEVAQIQTMRGYRLAKINIFPYQYFASKNLIRHFRKLRIIINFPEFSSQRSPESIQARAITNILEKTVVNYNQARKWQAFAPQRVKRTQNRFFARAGQNQILKILIHEDGLYQLTPAELEQAGFPVNEIDPRNLKMLWRGNEIPIIVNGEEDGKFDSTDAILFWGQRNRGDDGEFYNSYSDTAVYWLIAGEAQGKRFAKKQVDNANNYPEEQIFRRTLHFEKDLLYYQGDKGYAPDTKPAPGEGWVWKFLYPDQSFTYSFILPAIDVAADSGCRIKFRVRGITVDPAASDHQLRVELNGETVANFQFNDQEELVRTIEVPASSFKIGENSWRLYSEQTAANINKIYFDWLEIDCPVTTERSEGWLPFRSSESGNFSVNLWNQISSQFSVLNLTQEIELVGFQLQAKQRYIIHLFSAGFDDGNWCKIEINGVPAIDGGYRGHNIVVFDTLNGQIEDKKWFDTLDKTENSDSMAAFIGRIPEGKIVLVAIRDEGSYRMTEAAYLALESLGSSLARQVGFRDSYVLLGRKGAAQGTVPEIHMPQHQGPAQLTDTLFAHQQGNYALEFQTNFNKGDQWLVAGNDSLKKADKILPFEGSNLRDTQNQADYIFVTHKKFQSVAQEFANFWQQRGLTTFIAYVNDIYDEFNFGIKHPIGIKEFLKYAYQNWGKPAPSYVLLIGDASWDPKKNMSASVKQDFVPSWGNPVADIWYVCLDGDEDWLPEMFIGRLPIENVEQGMLYLQKMIDYENYPSARWKKQICLINGGFDDQEQYIFGYQTNEIVKDFVTPPPAALLPTVISKELDGLYEGEKREEIVQAINEGKIWVNFIGHGGSGTWELMFHDQQVFELENQGKLPLVTSFTCHTGRFANPQITNFGENFILYSEAGAIAFIGTTGWGFIYEDDIIARALFRTILADTIREFGAALTLAKVRFWQDVYISNRAEDVFLQYSLLGDPALAFTLPDKPDLVVTPENIAISPETVVESDSIAEIDARIENFGLATADSVQLQITDIYALAGPEDLFLGKISPVENQKMVRVPFSVSEKAGEHTIAVTIDPADQIEEVDEQNNQASRTIFVSSSHLSIARPAENMILPFDRIELQVYASSDSAEETYFFQLDTANNFNYPILQSMTESTGIFVASWHVPSLDTGKIYFWRCKKNSSDKSSLWVNGDFFVSDHFGWGQFSPLQMAGNNFAQTEIFAEEGIALTGQKTVFRVESSGFDDSNYAILFINSTPVSTSGRGHNIAVCDPYGEFIEFRNFDTHASAEDVAAMVSFLNSIPRGYFVLAGIRDSGAQQMTEEAYLALEQIGSKYCREVGFRDSWAIVGKKGAAIGSVPEQFVQRFGGVAVAEDTLITFPAQGSVETNKIGPAVQWKELDFDIKSEDSNTDFTISVYGYNQNSFQWDKLKSNIVNAPLNLGDINAKEYPYLRLSVDLLSNDRFNSPILKAWQISFEPASDLAISEKTVKIYPEKVIQGGTVELIANVYNIGYADADSVEAVLWRINSQGEKELVEKTILANVSYDSFEKNDFKVPVLQAGGEQKFSLEIDPENKITELVEANNQTSKIITVFPDTIAPRLEVTFDGKTIMDGDYVAQKPVIEILFFDNSPFELSEDTTHVHIFLDGEKVAYGEQEGMAQIFYGASETDSTLKARIQIIKEFPDGEHILSVLGTDINKNSVHVENAFTVISKLALLNVYNYPNPFETSTRFTFHLTQPAEKVSIKIFTTNGRLINQLEKYYCEAGYHQISWDGKDRDGDEIANGVYLYKIIAVNKDERAEKIEKCVIAR